MDAGDRKEDGAERHVVEDFLALIEKSQQLFAGLRDLPPHGYRLWQPYFEKTFAVYTKLWKFQQEHRAVLERKDRYGMKRYEIGEIASKIGQLYYHYYLRTSETRFLQESFMFYHAIRKRGYFKEVMAAGSQVLVIKKLRYYARFVVVGLLLGMRDLVQELLLELTTEVDKYGEIFEPTDAGEWLLVLQEVAAFLQSDQPLQIISKGATADSKLNLTPLVMKIRPSLTPVEATASSVRLSDAVLVGHASHQVKFSELTIDMFRFLQILEFESPKASFQPSSPTSMHSGGSVSNAAQSSSLRQNPRKYLLYRPGFATFMSSLANTFRDLEDGQAMLVYMSADGSSLIDNEEKNSALSTSFSGGVQLLGMEDGGDKIEDSAISAMRVLHPGDLIPFTRRPLVMVIDSDTAFKFKNMPGPFGIAPICIMSPSEAPPSAKDQSFNGSLMTMFLWSPLAGFASVTGLSQLTNSAAIEVQQVIAEKLKEFTCFLKTVDGLHKQLASILDCEILAQLLGRFCLFHSLLAHHMHYSNPDFLPMISPELPAGVLDGVLLQGIVGTIAALLDVAGQFKLSP